MISKWFNKVFVNSVGADPTEVKYYRVAVVSLGLLCALLLAVIIWMGTKYTAEIDQQQRNMDLLQFTTWPKRKTTDRQQTPISQKKEANVKLQTAKWITNTAIYMTKTAVKNVWWLKKHILSAVSRQRWTQLLPRRHRLQLMHLRYIHNHLNTDHTHLPPSQSANCAITCTCTCHSHYLYTSLSCLTSFLKGLKPWWLQLQTGGFPYDIFPTPYFHWPAGVPRVHSKLWVMNHFSTCPAGKLQGFMKLHFAITTHIHNSPTPRSFCSVVPIAPLQLKTRWSPYRPYCHSATPWLFCSSVPSCALYFRAALLPQVIFCFALWWSV